MNARTADALPALRVFFAALTQPGGFPAHTGEALSSGALDWEWLATYLTGSGLARPMLGLLADPRLARHAPPSFLALLAQAGTVDLLRDRRQQAVVSRLADALAALGGHGILLKGMALRMRAAGNTVARATGDVDILVAPALAPHLRRHLLAHGFTGGADGGPSTFQHLAPVSCEDVDVEIHTQVMAPYWGLPEREMVEHVRPIPGVEVLHTFGPEALVLHSVVHLTASFFSYGMKTAWDITAVARDWGRLDWDAVGRLAGACTLPRAFWAPLLALADGLPLDVPTALRARAPRDGGMRRIEALAHDRLFDATRHIYELDALSKSAFMLLLHDSWAGRLRYLRQKAAFRGARPQTWGAAAQRARRADLFRQAWDEYRRYRRAIAAGRRPR